MKTNLMTERLYEYVADHNPLPHPILKEVMETTAKLPYAAMQISPDQGTFMYTLAKLIGAKRAIEIGCFTGFSAIATASALPQDGKLITLDIDPETGAIAQEFFNRAGLTDRIELRLGAALDNLDGILQSEGEGCMDIAFIDADKANMKNYFELCLKLVRSGGVILVDNVLWGGSVVDPEKNDEQVAAIRDFNTFVKGDTRVETALVHISDGITVARKK